MSTNLREALAFIAENSEVFAAAVNKKTGAIDVAQLETLAVRGDALAILERKFSNVPADDRSEFLDRVNTFASDIAAGCAKTGTSGDQRFSLVTPSGKLTVVLSEQPK